MNQELSEIKIIIKSLIVSDPGITTVGKLNEYYCEIVGQYIPYATFGFSMLEEFLKSIPDALSNRIIRLLDFPSGVANFNDKIPPFEIPPEIEKSNYFPILVSKIYNPHKFWFQLLKAGEHELDSLEDKLKHVYGNLDRNELLMLETNIRPGQICCIKHFNFWYRGEILENQVNDTVKVLFVDYGVISNVRITNVNYLLKNFCKLPGQALRGSLSHIKPISHRWTRDATLCFLNMTFELILYATPTEIDHTENVVHMIIVDTNNKKELNINKALIIKGHARYFSNYPNELHEKSAVTTGNKEK